MARFTNPIPQYVKANGDLVAGGQLFFYESGTDTLLTIYADVNESITIANPVSLGGRGEVPNIFFSASARCVLQDADGVQLFDVDPVNSTTSAGAYDVWNSSIVYNRNDTVFANNGEAYISLVDDNQGNDPTLNAGSNSNWSRQVLLQIYNSERSYSPDEYAILDGVIYRSQIDANQNNDPATDNGSNWKSIADAVYVDYNNVASGLVAVTAQGALDEIKSLIDNLPSSVVYRGQLDVSGGDASLPASPQNGDLYVIAVAGTITVSQAGGAPTAVAVNVGEQIIYNGDTLNWDLIAQVTQASSISYNNSTSGLAATDVQTAIDEVEGRVQVNESDISTNASDIASNTSAINSNASAISSNTSAINTKAPIANPIFTGTVTAPTFRLGSTTITATGNELNILDGVTATTAEINKLDGVTATTTELNYTDGVTSNIQTQLNTKAPIASPTFTGNPAIPQYILHAGDGDTFLGFPAVNTFIVNTGSLERMRITASGNVGVGTSSPLADFVVSDGGAEGLEVDTTALAEGIRLLAFDRVGAAETGMVYRATPHIFQTNGVERMRIGSSGNVGIGSTSPSGTLEVNTGSGAGVNFTRDAGDDGVSGTCVNFTTSVIDTRIQSSGNLVFRVGGIGTAANSQPERMRIDASGTVTVGGKEIGYNQVDVVLLGASATVTQKNTYYVKNTTSNITITLSNTITTGTVITISNPNSAGNITLAAGSGDSLVWFSGSGIVTGNRTIAVGGAVSVIKRSASVFDMFGTGVS